MKPNSTLNRRTFLKASAAIAAVVAFDGWAGAAQGELRWPVAIRDSMLKETGSPDCWAALKAVGAQGVEVSISSDMTCPGLFHPQRKHTLATADGIAALKQDLSANGVAITAFAMGNRFDEQLDAEIAWMKKLAPACADLGVRSIRIDVVPHKVKRDVFLPVAIKACKEVAAIAADANVRLGIENHGNTTNDPEFLQKLFDGASAVNLGLTLDTANFYWFGHPLGDLYGFFEKLAPRIFHTHCKSIRYPDDRKNVRREMGWKYAEYTCPIYEGDIDFARVTQILAKAGYTGDLCLENESLGRFPADQRSGILKKEITMLRTLAQRP